VVRPDSDRTTELFAELNERRKLFFDTTQLGIVLIVSVFADREFF
jgi:hypothetical protein